MIFFHGIKSGIRKPATMMDKNSQLAQAPEKVTLSGDIDETKLLKCPACGKMTYRNDGGCATCIDPECGFGKCDS